MRSVSLQDADGSFEVSVFDAARPARGVLFAVGAGGNPRRHQPLLAALAERGCSVVAPHFERLTSPIPTGTQLLQRARRHAMALELVPHPELPIAGVGHSIGGAMLLALAGGQPWTAAGERLQIARDARLDRIALLAPALDFFRAPHALEGVRTPIAVWVGSADALSPPERSLWMQRALTGRAQVVVRVTEHAGHLSFLHELPPNAPEPLPDRDGFLAALTAEVCAFVTRTAAGLP